jgi:hypothetical protein
MKKAVFIIFIFILSGCFNPEPPKWYVNTPKDTGIYFYASAESYTKQNAVKNALNDIASRINVKISSNFVINKGIHNQKTYNEIYQQINTQVSNVSFNNYEIIKTKKEDDKYYVLLRVNKEKMINTLKIKLGMEFKQIDFKEKSPLKRVVYAYNVLYKLKKIKSDVFILESLGVDITGYISKMENIEKKALNIIKNTSFRVKSDKYKTQTLEALSKYLIISNTSKNIINVQISTQKYHLFDSFIIKGSATISLDKPYTVNFLGKSVSSYKEAENFAKEEYKIKLLRLLNKIFKISVF